MRSFKGVIILDAGHGKETPGKRSPVWPDGSQLIEAEFNLKVVLALAERLKGLGLRVALTRENENDVSLGARVVKANQITKENPDSFLISVHANAGGGTGWECFTSPGETESDVIATYLSKVAKSTWGKDWRMRFDYTDEDPDKEELFYILRKTLCPAVLTENFFMDTFEDCKYIMNFEGVSDVIEVHLLAILEYLAQTYA